MALNVNSRHGTEEDRARRHERNHQGMGKTLIDPGAELGQSGVDA
jgi:hypothetical protein